MKIFLEFYSFSDLFVRDVTPYGRQTFNYEFCTRTW